MGDDRYHKLALDCRTQAALRPLDRDTNAIWLKLAEEYERLKRDDFSSNRHLALGYWWSMIFSENRRTLFGIML